MYEVHRGMVVVIGALCALFSDAKIYPVLTSRGDGLVTPLTKNSARNNEILHESNRRTL